MELPPLGPQPSASANSAILAAVFKVALSIAKNIIAGKLFLTCIPRDR